MTDKVKFLFVFLLIFAFLGNASFLAAGTDSDSVQVDLNVNTLCGNGSCDSGETPTNCPRDCGCNYNGICEPARGENYQNCLSDCPVPKKPGGKVDIVPPAIYNLFVSKITLNSAKISWETDEEALCQLHWGRTADYREKAASEDSFSLKHSTLLTGLSPDATYHFKVFCEDKRGNDNETKDQRFSTLSPPDIVPPANVSKFEADPRDKEIILSWQNPPDFDFDGVRIVRSDYSFPSGPFEGELVYEGDAVYFIDTGLENGTRYYYSAFAYDKNRNYSSGAVATAIPGIPPEPLKPPLAPEIPEEIKELKLSDFDFFQNGKKLPLIEGKLIRAEPYDSITVSINKEKMPKIVKTATFAIEEKSNISVYLLRINETAYQASFSLGVGYFPFDIIVFNKDFQRLKVLEGAIEIEERPLIVTSWYKNYSFWLYVIIILLIFFVLLLLLVWITKKLFDEDEKNNDDSNFIDDIPPSC